MSLIALNRQFPVSWCFLLQFVILNVGRGVVVSHIIIIALRPVLYTCYTKGDGQLTTSYPSEAGFERQLVDEHITLVLNSLHWLLVIHRWYVLVTSRLDYGNALIYGLLSTLVERLQRIQNSITWLVTRIHKREHITSVLNCCLWLPEIYKSQYKTLVYAYKALHMTIPQHWEKLVVAYHPTRSPRSESEALLTVPQTRGVT